MIYDMIDSIIDTLEIQVLPVPQRIDQPTETATVVHWKDGTYTSVNISAGDTNNVYAAFCAALAKKLYGSTSAVHKMIDKTLGTEIDRREEEAKRKRDAEQKERAEANRRHEIAEMRKLLSIIKEAWGDIND